MTNWPIHRMTQISACGIRVKTINPSSLVEPFTYDHSDDYYIFGQIEEGDCRVCIDFEEIRYSENETMFIRPGQVHRFIDSSGLKARMLIIDSALVDDNAKLVFDGYVPHTCPLPTDDRSRREIGTLFALLAERIERTADETSNAIIRHLSSAIVGIFAETARRNRSDRPTDRRYAQIVSLFRKLLDEKLPENRKPSCYADASHITPGYLNEAVKRITGSSVGQNIRTELVLRAKRMLIHTPKSVGEIALELGFEDPAYFTRLFTRQTGMAPAAFKKKYLG